MGAAHKSKVVYRGANHRELSPEGRLRRPDDLKHSRLIAKGVVAMKNDDARTTYLFIAWPKRVITDSHRGLITRLQNVFPEQRIGKADLVIGSILLVTCFVFFYHVD